MRIAYFVTPHGYGHAARACAVMNAIHRMDKSSTFEIFTTIPEWFFKDSLQDCPFSYHPFMVDVGFIQTSPLSIDFLATISRLQMFIPFTKDFTADVASILQQKRIEWIISDISPLGIHLASELNIPSVLIENFTWDWIYKDYLDTEPEFEEPIQYFSRIYKRVDVHIQTRPFCNPDTNPAFISNPVSRTPRFNREQTRRQLGIGNMEPLILITFGGFQPNFSFLERLHPPDDIYFIVPGLDPFSGIPGNIIPLSHHSDIFHPDLVGASDAVIGKVGYSTIAEAYNAGKPFGYIPRAGFKESPVLEKFIRKNMPAIEIQEEDFFYGNWRKQAYQLLELPAQTNHPINGSDQIANFLFTNVFKLR